MQSRFTEIRKAQIMTEERIAAASPAAFGFLDNDVAPVTFKGGKISPPDDEDAAAGIQFPEGETLSVIGGNIEINRGIYYQQLDEEGNPFPVTVANLNARQQRSGNDSAHRRKSPLLQNPAISSYIAMRLSLWEKSL